jgi:hypothetical protein
MKLEKYLDTFYWFLGKTSDVARQLAFAAIAVIWVFRYTDGSNQILPRGGKWGSGLRYVCPAKGRVLLRVQVLSW